MGQKGSWHPQGPKVLQPQCVPGDHSTTPAAASEISPPSGLGLTVTLDTGRSPDSFIHSNVDMPAPGRSMIAAGPIRMTPLSPPKKSQPVTAHSKLDCGPRCRLNASNAPAGGSRWKEPTAHPGKIGSCARSSAAVPHSSESAFEESLASPGWMSADPASSSGSARWTVQAAHRSTDKTNRTSTDGPLAGNAPASAAGKGTFGSEPSPSTELARWQRRRSPRAWLVPRGASIVNREDERPSRVPRLVCPTPWRD
jgi:hypothetical protein